jgi:hypothetical protein
VSERRTRLVDCNPRWVTGRYAGRDDDTPVGVHFDCPEGHEGCSHAIPFTPALDGGPAASWYTSSAIWQRTGDTFETLTLSPSIRRNPQHASREAAIAAGCIPEYITDSLLCAFHGFVRDGQIEFCGDSR